VDFDLHKSLLVTCSVCQKNSDTCAFSKAEAWQRSSLKRLYHCRRSHLRWYLETPSTSFDRVAGYVLMHSGGIHTFSILLVC